MRKTTRREIVATVESEVGSGVEFSVSDDRSVTLMFPNAVMSSFGGTRLPFVRTLTPDEARAIGTELIDAANRVTSVDD